MEKAIILTYKDLYGIKYDKSKIIDMLSELEWETIQTIVFLLQNRNKNYNSIRDTYIKSKLKKMNDDEIYKITSIICDEKYMVLSLQGLLNLLKYMYAYCKCNRNLGYKEFTIDKKKIVDIIDIQLMLNDYIQTEINDNNFLLYCMKKLNLDVNIKNLLSRTWYIYCNLTQDTEKLSNNINMKQYLPFNEDYYEEYGYSIEDFLAVHFYLFNNFMGEKIYIPFINIEKYFDKARDSELCRKMLLDIECGVDEFIKYSKDNMENSWDYEILTSNPLLKVYDKYACIPSDLHLQSFLFRNFKNRIQKLYSKEGNELAQFLGYPFEIYIQELCSEAINGTNLDGTCEFQVRKGLKSNDFYIKKNRELIVIEVKAYDINREKVFNRLDEDIINGIVMEQFYGPINQIDKRCKDIKSSSKKDFLNGIDCIYALAINFENSHLSVPIYHDMATKEIFKDIKTQEIKYVFNFSIDELETICWMIENGTDIFDLLKDYFQHSSYMPFYNYLNNNNIYYQTNPRKIEEMFEGMKNKFNKFFI